MPIQETLPFGVALAEERHVLQTTDNPVSRRLIQLPRQEEGTFTNQPKPSSAHDTELSYAQATPKPPLHDTPIKIVPLSTEDPLTRLLLDPLHTEAVEQGGEVLDAYYRDRGISHPAPTVRATRAIQEPERLSPPQSRPGRVRGWLPKVFRLQPKSPNHQWVLIDTEHIAEIRTFAQNHNRTIPGQEDHAGVPSLLVVSSPNKPMSTRGEIYIPKPS